MKNIFDSPKPLSEIVNQLAIEGYHHPKGAVQTALNRDFMKKVIYLLASKRINFTNMLLKNKGGG